MVSFTAHFRTDNNASIYGNTLCSMWDPTQRSCTVQISKDYRNGDIKCPCNAACNDEYYTYSQSSSEWPNENYAPYLISNIRKSTQSDAIRDDQSEFEALFNSEFCHSHFFLMRYKKQDFSLGLEKIAF